MDERLPHGRFSQGEQYHMADNLPCCSFLLPFPSPSPAQISGKYPNKIIVTLTILCVHFVLIFTNINSNLSTNTYSCSLNCITTLYTMILTMTENARHIKIEEFHNLCKEGETHTKFVSTKFYVPFDQLSRFYNKQIYFCISRVLI